MKTTMYKGKKVGVIDCTPTWEGILPGLLAVLEDGNTEGRAIAKQELKRMAKAADGLNSLGKEYISTMNVIDSVDTAFAVLFIGSDHGITPQAMKACTETANDVRLLLDKHKEREYSIVLIDDDGKVVDSVKTEKDLLDYTNTCFEYDRRDADEDEITDVFIAIRELRKGGFKVKVS